MVEWVDRLPCARVGVATEGTVPPLDGTVRPWPV